MKHFAATLIAGALGAATFIGLMFLPVTGHVPVPPLPVFVIAFPAILLANFTGGILPFWAYFLIPFLAIGLLVDCIRARWKIVRRSTE